MKIKNVIITAIILFFANSVFELSAQENIKAVMKKCESMDNVEVKVVRQKDKETLKVTQSIVTVNIESNKALIDEFITAFTKDEPSAHETIFNKKNGKMIPKFFRFKNVTFSFHYDEEDNDARITMIEAPSK